MCIGIWAHNLSEIIWVITIVEAKHIKFMSKHQTNLMKQLKYKININMFQEFLTSLIF